MKKNAKILAIILVLVLLVGVLCACHKDKDKNEAQQKRNSAVNSVANTFLSGVDSNWRADMSVEEISTLENAGEYVVANGWTRLVCDVLNASPMQTAKLQLIADTLSSDDGKKLIAEFANNAELLIPMLKEVGFTAEDISAVAYSLVVKLTADGQSTLNAMIEKLDAVKDCLYASQSNQATIIDEINQNKISTQRLLDVVKMSDSEKNEILSALDEAQSAFKQLVEFAYDASVGSITNELYDSLVGQDGVLGNINKDEVAIVVRSILSNVGNLGSALKEQDIDNLNKALNLFITHFDNNGITSALYAQIVTYAKYAYMVVDIIPSLCDVAVASESVLSNMSFITDFLKVVSLNENDEVNSSTNSLNNMILISRVIKGVMDSGEFSLESIGALVDSISVSGNDAYKKAMPLIALDVLLNVSAIAENIDDDTLTVVHPDIISKQDLQDMLAGLFLNAFVDQFKEAYYQYMADGLDASYTKMFNLASLCAFNNFTEQRNPYNANTQTQAWYSWYMSNALPKANATLTNCADKVKRDFKAFVGDYFTNGSQSKAAIEQIAGMIVFEKSISDSEMDEKYMPILIQSRLIGFLYVI